MDNNLRDTMSKFIDLTNESIQGILKFNTDVLTYIKNLEAKVDRLEIEINTLKTAIDKIITPF